MHINIGDYSYSYANAIGSALQKPLFMLVSNVAATHASYALRDRQITRVAKLAFHCLAALVCMAPAGLAWLMGRVIAYFGSTRLDYESLHLAPPSVEIHVDGVSDIDIRQLVTWYED